MKKRSHSLYIRLLFVFGLTFLAIVLSMGLVFKLSRPPEAKNFFPKIFESFGDYLVRDIGSPPDLDRARALSEELQIDVLVEGPGILFSTREGLNPQDRPECKEPVRPQSRWRRCGSYHERSLGAYRYGFSHYSFRGVRSKFFVIGVGGFLALLILIMSYHWVRRILSPLREMRLAAEGYAKGDWGYRVSTDHCDELGSLAETMNRMAAQIERHFRSARELLVAVSHELRSPLARMRVALEFIQDEKIKKSLRDEIVALDELTGNLLERERIESRPDLLDRQETSVRQLVEGVVQAYDERIRLRIDGDFSYQMDRSRMAICLRNLIENALKYSGGEVLVTFNGEERWISVKDHGPGIPEQDLEHLMEPFFQVDPGRGVDRRKGGFGLGLSLCQSIARAHDLDFALLSKVGLGSWTEARITFPVSAE